MPASSIAPYKNNTQTVTFGLASSGTNEVAYLQSGNPIMEPHSITKSTKLSKGASNSLSTVVYKLVKRNATTGKLATFQIKYEVSIPQDSATITNAMMIEGEGILASHINDDTALAATTAQRTAIVEGRFA